MSVGRHADEVKVTIPVPEPDLTPDELVARAESFVPRLLEEQAATEERRYYPAELHRDFVAAGLTRILQPRRFGGYEFDIATFYRAMLAISRGCPSTAWCLTLGGAHCLWVGAFCEEDVQAELFGPDGDFVAPLSSAPDESCVATAVEGGYRVQGLWRFCSGVPHSTHFMGEIARPDDDPYEPGGSMVVIVPRGQYEILNDWGDLIGQKGSGSHSVRVPDVFVPTHLTVAGNPDIFPDIAAGTIGSRLHGNPMYAESSIPLGIGELTCLQVGAAMAMLDEWERVVAGKPMIYNVPSYDPKTASDIVGEAPGPRPPRFEDRDYQRVFGMARASIDSAHAILLYTAEESRARTRAAIEDGEPFTPEDVLRLYGQHMTAYGLCWDAVGELFRTASTSGARDGTRMQRYWRDACTLRAAGWSQFDFSASAIAQAHFGTVIAFP